MISTKKINKRRCNVRVILWIIHIQLLVSLSVKENDKRFPIWITSLSVIGIFRVLVYLNNLNMSFSGN